MVGVSHLLRHSIIQLRWQVIKLYELDVLQASGVTPRCLVSMSSTNAFKNNWFLSFMKRTFNLISLKLILYPQRTCCMELNPFHRVYTNTTPDIEKPKPQVTDGGQPAGQPFTIQCVVQCGFHIYRISIHQKQATALQGCSLGLEMCFRTSRLVIRPDVLGSSRSCHA